MYADHKWLCLTLVLLHPDHVAITESNAEMFAAGAKAKHLLILNVQGCGVTNTIQCKCKGITQRYVS